MKCLFIKTVVKRIIKMQAELVLALVPKKACRPVGDMAVSFDVMHTTMKFV